MVFVTQSEFWPKANVTLPCSEGPVLEWGTWIFLLPLTLWPRLGSIIVLYELPQSYRYKIQNCSSCISGWTFNFFSFLELKNDERQDHNSILWNLEKHTNFSRAPAHNTISKMLRVCRFIWFHVRLICGWGECAIRQGTAVRCRALCCVAVSCRHCFAKQNCMLGSFAAPYP